VDHFVEPDARRSVQIVLDNSGRPEDASRFVSLDVVMEMPMQSMEVWMSIESRGEMLPAA